MAFTATGEDLPVPARGLGEGVQVVTEHPFLAAGQMRPGQFPRQPPIPLGPAGQDQQMRPGRVGQLGAGSVAERQFGAENRRHVEFFGGLGETHDTVEPVVIGQGDGPQIQPDGLLHQLLRGAGAIEEAVRGMGVQLGIRHRRSRPRRTVDRAIVTALTRPRRAVTAVGRRLGGSTGHPRFTLEHPLHLRPARRPVVPTHHISVFETLFEHQVCRICGNSGGSHPTRSPRAPERDGRWPC
ncbi:Uncharacterised protein [Mycobacteroides abscessus subsp. abscessus]|nr:Uncharacterised protein [Mycobacteroides abscessus subsp. abscessus]